MDGSALDLMSAGTVATSRLSVITKVRIVLHSVDCPTVAAGSRWTTRPSHQGCQCKALRLHSPPAQMPAPLDSSGHANLTHPKAKKGLGNGHLKARPKRHRDKGSAAPKPKRRRRKGKLLCQCYCGYMTEVHLL